MKNKNLLASVGSIAIPLFMAFIASTIVLIISGNPADTMIAGFAKMFSNPNIMNSVSIQSLLTLGITPLIFTGLSVAVAFRGGLFNIGAEGQFIFGSTFGVVIGEQIQGLFPPFISFVIIIVAGMLGGVLIGIVPGILKAIFEVNEVVICIMMNYVALYLSNLLIGGRTETGVINTEISNFASFGGLLRLDIIVGLLMIILFYIVINKTVFGYELRASGLNRNAAIYAGMNVKKNIILTMAISGGLAGLGGIFFSFASTTVKAPQLSGFYGYGFTGIAVALLGLSTALGVLLAAILFGMLYQSGKEVATLYTPPVSQQISAILTALIVFFVSFQEKMKKYIMTKLEIAEMKKEDKQDGE